MPNLRLLGLWLLVGAWLPHALLAQQGGTGKRLFPLYQPRHVQLGLSAGVGGVYGYAWAAVDVHYRPVALHLSPSPFFAGASLSVPFGPRWKRTDCNHRLFFIEVGALDDWLLGNQLRPSGVRNRTVGFALLGLHHPLNRRNRLWLEYGIGAAQQWNRMRGSETIPERTETSWYPMLTVRMGGILRWPVPPR